MNSIDVGDLAANRFQYYAMLFFFSMYTVCQAEQATGLHGNPGTYESVLAELQQVPVGDNVETLSKEASASLEDLRVGNEKWRTRLQNMYVDFRSVVEQLQSKNSGMGKWISSFDISCRYGFKGGKEFVWYRDNTGEAGDDVKRFSRYIVYNMINTKDFQEFADIGAIHAHKLDGSDAYAREYMNGINFPLEDKLRVTTWYIPYALSLRGQYRVLPQLQRVGGHDCCVVTSDFDTIWIDTTCGFAPRRRVVFRNLSKDNSKSALWYIQSFQDLRLVDDGIWLPMEFHTVVYGVDPSHQDTFGEPVTRRSITVHEINVNKVDDSLFEFEFPPGTLVSDFTKKVSYYMPDGTHLLDKAIAEGKPLLGNRIPELPGRLEMVGRSIQRQVLLGLNLFVVVALAIFLIVRRLRLRKAMWR